ncbi:MAG TPA: Crp/Fnr family transcriptional regulator [Chryseolinea sp.]|nr:Crp/Fnr family transcriptional regulator [Chryseolinea sp.]
MNELIHYLLQFGHLNQQQIELIQSKFHQKEIEKDTYYQKAGQIPNEFIFITEGVMRVCYYDHNGDEITKAFVDEHKLVADIVNYNIGSPSTEYIQAITHCKYLTISKSAMEDLSQTVITWDAIIAKIISKGLTQKVNIFSRMMAEDATERYQKFLIHFPNIVNRIPLSYVASFLGMTQSSLSRIRKNIS